MLLGIIIGVAATVIAGLASWKMLNPDVFSRLASRGARRARGRL